MYLSRLLQKWSRVEELVTKGGKVKSAPNFSYRGI